MMTKCSKIRLQVSILRTNGPPVQSCRSGATASWVLIIMESKEAVFSLYRALSDLGKYLVLMKLGNNSMILGGGKIQGKNSAIFCQIGKVYLLNLDLNLDLQKGNVSC